MNAIEMRTPLPRYGRTWCCNQLGNSTIYLNLFVAGRPIDSPLSPPYICALTSETKIFAMKERK